MMQRLRGKRILVLEDEPLITLMLEDELARAGAAVISAYNCRQALASAQAERIDAATLDLHIGGGDCKPVADLLHARGIPFIVTTGDLDAPDLGAAGKVLKPFNPEHLIRTLLDVLPPAQND
jgi:DNA-binding response OmpR family regulator